MGGGGDGRGVMEGGRVSRLSMRKINERRGDARKRGVSGSMPRGGSGGEDERAAQSTTHVLRYMLAGVSEEGEKPL